MTKRIHKLTIPSSTRYLEDVRQFVEVHAADAKFPEDTVEQLKMAVDEACANVIKHAYKGEAEHPIDIAVIVQPDRFTVRIRDEGESFDPSNYTEPDLMKFARARRAGGLGVHIMRRLMDQVEYKKRGRKNECCLTKYRS
ncbi:MAG: ATP-binding protein [Rhodothermales bacterium]|nr:ATP-binding protein [Rhodothermales bacterium]MBO6781383.1 ATP-binding protein [Rhodothermales bacterium]